MEMLSHDWETQIMDRNEKFAMSGKPITWQEREDKTVCLGVPKTHVDDGIQEGCTRLHAQGHFKTNNNKALSRVCDALFPTPFRAPFPNALFTVNNCALDFSSHSSCPSRVLGFPDSRSIPGFHIHS